MTCLRAFFVAIAVIALFPTPGNSQIGIAYQPLTANTELSCMALGAGAPELRPEGYSELLGDIIVSCTGGPLMPVGTVVPTMNLVLYVVPSVPITSRIIGDNGASEALLIIDEAGASVPTGATGGYGPQAPQTLCSTAQQLVFPTPCQPAIGLDTSGTYQVAVLPGTTTPAPNVFRGKIGDFGQNSVTFYNVPVLPPAYTGVSRVFRITNVRVPVAGSVGGVFQIVLSASPSQVLPMNSAFNAVGVVGPSMSAAVNPASALGLCVPVPAPTLVSQVTFTEGFSTSFKTRVVPGGGSQTTNSPLNTLYEAQTQNLASPANQNIPGSHYGNYLSNSESNLILPAANTTVSNITYTAGLADFGTRLKAVFTNIPAGVSLYVSTTSSGALPAVPGGLSTAAYAVLVADSQSKEATPDGATFTPLSSALTGSDGLRAYPLIPDANGAAAAIWEVVNAVPQALDSLTFSVYVTYASTPGTVVPTNASPRFAPEPGGGTFSPASATQALTSPMPRFSVLKIEDGPWANIGACSLQASTQTVAFNYAGVTLPPSQTVPLSAVPANLPVTVTPLVTSPSGGNWLAGTVSGGNLIISVNPTNLAAGTYSGSIKLSASSVSSISVPVSLSVTWLSALSIVKTHSGDFTPGQQGATYSLVVNNSPAAQMTQGNVTVTEQIPAGLTLVSMQGTDWDCSTLPSCKRGDRLAPGGTWPAITVTVNVDANPPSRAVNQATVSGGASATALAYDITTTGPLTCTVTGDPTAKVTDVQHLLQEALGIVPPAYDLNSDKAVNIADVQIVANAALGNACAIH